LPAELLLYYMRHTAAKKLRERINSDVDNCLRNAKQKEEEIINKAIITAGDLVTKTVPLSALIKKYTGGIHDKYRGKIGSEMTSFKAAIKAAVETYKSESVKSKKIQPTGELAEDFFSDYDNVILPKK